MKVACVTQSKDEMKRFADYLSKGYEIQNQDGNFQAGRHTSVFTLKENPDFVSEMFSLLIAATGVDISKVKSKEKKILKVRKAACYLLYYRFGLSHPKIAELMGYSSHSSSLLICRGMGQIEVKNVPIELAIRKTLDSL